MLCGRHRDIYGRTFHGAAGGKSLQCDCRVEVSVAFKYPVDELCFAVVHCGNRRKPRYHVSCIFDYTCLLPDTGCGSRFPDSMWMKDLEIERFQRIQIEIENLRFITGATVAVAIFVFREINGGFSAFHIAAGNEACVCTVHFLDDCL